MTIDEIRRHAVNGPPEARDGTVLPVNAFRAPRRGIATAVLALGDVVSLEAAVLLAVLLRMQLSPWFPIDVNADTFVGVAVAALFLPPVYALAGLYPGYGQTSVERLRKRITVTALSFGAMILFDRMAQDDQWSRGILLGAAALSLAFIPVWDSIARRILIRRGWWGEAVVVLGPEARRRPVVDALTRHRELGWVPVAEGDMPGPTEPPVRGVATAVVVLPDRGIGDSSMADDLPYRRVVLVPAMDEVQSLWVSVRDLGTHLGLETQRNLLIPANQVIKRTLDLTVGGVALLLSIPVIAACALLVTMMAPGPIFYTQVRLGRGGRPFRLWKLRTMVPGADTMLNAVIDGSDEARADWNQSMKIRNDPRIIPVLGHAMRRFSIDELPQFWNVLRGDMSLVGPRPLPSYHVARLDPAADRMRRRVRPGITGLWQVSGRSAASLSDQQRMDIYYVRNWSLWLDLHILARTLVVVVTGKGAW
ncbi:exopolysaccharide biosynthesis polyprenyl glycosylphosphotransferase [Azospirillum sp.]|uniref:exopolysaccharide biosynthesis polyprenyl glycosylphosphotransferase n=1 Tax=Azospirillum sp. TaxID=34012 RepID=UPI002D69A933|nr:exopolysaccharide biosynthesis polyprenyl glycosylphosphotransferase [Azospirillum sp.]HYD69836.1 exopolysaccharide biosynthesis polyprenyl glycosylphosphotransferase [Azospirillum sp.]